MDNEKLLLCFSCGEEWPGGNPGDPCPACESTDTDWADDDDDPQPEPLPLYLL